MNDNGDRIHRFNRKDEDGLTLAMREVLQEMAHEPDIRRACGNAKVPFSTVKSWLQKEPGFQAAYDNLTTPATELIREIMEGHAMRATGMYAEAIDATDVVDVEVKCPDCDNVFHTEVAQPNWQARLKAGEVAMKVARVLKDVRESTHVNIKLTLEEAVAVAAIKSGRPVPPAMFARLRAKGALDEVDTSSLLASS